MSTSSRVAPPADQVVFFQSIHDTYRAAATAAGEEKHNFSLAGFTLCLRFAGAALVPLMTPAFEHLRLPHAGALPDLTVCLWDSESTGVDLPSMLAPGIPYAPQIDTHSQPEPRIQTGLAA